MARRLWAEAEAKTAAKAEFERDHQFILPEEELREHEKILRELNNEKLLNESSESNESNANKKNETKLRAENESTEDSNENMNEK